MLSISDTKCFGQLSRVAVNSEVTKSHSKGDDESGKFVSGAKVLAAVPSISQPRRVYLELYPNEDKLEIGGKQFSTKTEILSFGRVFFWNRE